ncbi:hypothetical protein PG985_010345 [Apiospora marii]|uniref:uncharacterized protein n=1 Tax=Apiospora marii TaxID=335849 RepID=UPI00312E0C50
MEPAEIDKLLKACQSPTGKGLFFLDLKCPSGEQLLSDLPKIGQGMLSYSGQLTETKMKDYREGVERGFKRPSEDIPLRAEASLPPPPPALQPHQSEIASILDAGHLLTKTLLQHLHPSAAADLTSGTSPSDTGLKLCLQSAAVPENSVTEAPHTDIGLLTFVSYDVPYLELAEKVSSSGDKTTEGEESQKQKVMEWISVQPQEGCVLVNVGDALQAASKGALRAPLHRVVQPRGPKPEGTCMVIYFLRPEEKKQGEQKASACWLS